MSETKRCTKCGEIKPLDEFPRNIRSSDGLNQWCKVCARAASREYYYRPHSPSTPLKIQSKWVTLTCEVCGREMKYRRTLIESRKARGAPVPRFCSRACSAWALNHSPEVRA